MRKKRWWKMSKYTTELRYLVETGYDLGLKDYPIFDESYRDVLNQKIIDHYYFREIGFETAGLFKKFLNRTMNEIMPFYNQMYESELLDFNPFYTHEFEETENFDRDLTQNTTSHGTVADNRNVTEDVKNLNNDTPMGRLTDAFATDYATSTNQSNNKSTQTINQNADSTNNNTENDSTTRVKKSQGKTDGKSYAQLLNEYRDSMINVDMMVIEELEDLFMRLW